MHSTPQVESYVEVRVQYYEKYAVMKRTYTDEGRMPRWNEILEFPLVADNGSGFTIEELASSETMIIVSLFDLQKYTTTRTEGDFTHEEHRFLGDIRIPLQSILTNPGKWEHNFKLNRPVLLPTYRVPEQEIFYMKKDEIEKQMKLENEQPPSYLNLSISLDPPIELPTENEEAYYPGYEDRLLLEDGAQWVNNMKTKLKRFRDPQI